MAVDLAVAGTGNGEIGVRSPSSMSRPVAQMLATGSQICRSCGFSMETVSWPLLMLSTS